MPLSIATIRSRSLKPGRYPDGDGLYLIVGRTGAKSWTVRLTADGRQQEFGLGSARDRHPQSRSSRSQGEAPRARGGQSYPQRAGPHAHVRRGRNSHPRTARPYLDLDQVQHAVAQLAHPKLRLHPVNTGRPTHDPTHPTHPGAEVEHQSRTRTAPTAAPTSRRELDRRPRLPPPQPRRRHPRRRAAEAQAQDQAPPLDPPQQGRPRPQPACGPRLTCSTRSTIRHHHRSPIERGQEPPAGRRSTWTSSHGQYRLPEPRPDGNTASPSHAPPWTFWTKPNHSLHPESSSFRHATARRSTHQPCGTA